EIGANHGAVPVERGRVVLYVVVEQAGKRGRAVVRQEVFRNRVNPVRRDDVARERLARERVVDEGAGKYLAEVPGKHLGGRYGEGGLGRLPPPQPLEVGHEEQLVSAVEEAG